jgi:hypothetical protein
MAQEQLPRQICWRANNQVVTWTVSNALQRQWAATRSIREYQLLTRPTSVSRRSRRV